MVYRLPHIGVTQSDDCRAMLEKQLWIVAQLCIDRKSGQESGLVPSDPQGRS